MGFSVIRTCAVCGKKNRLPAKHLTSVARCGSCKATLSAIAEPIDVDAESFGAIVQDARVPVLVDFWATWCGPCRVAAPHVQELAREMARRAIVLKVDTEAQADLAARFNVRAIPSFAVLRNGRTILQRAGVVPRAGMRRWIEEAEHTIAGV